MCDCVVFEKTKQISIYPYDQNKINAKTTFKTECPKSIFNTDTEI